MHIIYHHKKVVVQNFWFRGCYEIIKSKSDLKKHIQEDHPKAYRSYTCDLTFSGKNTCEKEYYTYLRLEKHRLLVTKKWKSFAIISIMGKYVL
jgi:hypothetical protein